MTEAEYQAEMDRIAHEETEAMAKRVIDRLAQLCIRKAMADLVASPEFEALVSPKH